MIYLNVLGGGGLYSVGHKSRTARKRCHFFIQSCTRKIFKPLDRKQLLLVITAGHLFFEGSGLPYDSLKVNPNFTRLIIQINPVTNIIWVTIAYVFSMWKSWDWQFEKCLKLKNRTSKSALGKQRRQNSELVVFRKKRVSPETSRILTAGLSKISHTTMIFLCGHNYHSLRNCRLMVSPLDGNFVSFWHVARGRPYHKSVMTQLLVYDSEMFGREWATRDIITFLFKICFFYEYDLTNRA